MTQIDAIIYSYKNKNLKSVVQALIDNTSNNLNIILRDQATIDRSNFFTGDKVIYEHVFWDKLISPCEFKGDAINKSDADYVLIISDDILVKKDWDLELIEEIKDRSVVISGYQKINIYQDGPFSIKTKRVGANRYTLNNYIDRNFIFASKLAWSKIEYPYFLKYNGEEELLSINFFRSGAQICSAPEEILEDLGARTIEKLYTPYSLDHKYNYMLDRIELERHKDTQRSLADFERFHGVFFKNLMPLPFQTDDVLYDPYGLEFQNVDSRKFISGIKAVY